MKLKCRCGWDAGIGDGSDSDPLLRASVICFRPRGPCMQVFGESQADAIGLWKVLLRGSKPPAKSRKRKEKNTRTIPRWSYEERINSPKKRKVKR